MDLEILKPEDKELYFLTRNTINDKLGSLTEYSLQEIRRSGDVLDFVISHEQEELYRCCFSSVDKLRTFEGYPIGRRGKRGVVCSFSLFSFRSPLRRIGLSTWLTNFIFMDFGYPSDQPTR